MGAAKDKKKLECGLLERIWVWRFLAALFPFRFYPEPVLLLFFNFFSFLLDWAQTVERTACH